ncbi:Secernin-2 [Armadillidium vulgare]|nr:Secernin-2 [Armadillidium vulgare]
MNVLSFRDTHNMPSTIPLIKLEPKSCDTFVVLGDLTKDGHVIFGKNSDRPNGEVQEVIYESAKDFSSGSKLQCTYIEIDQLEHTYAVILSKPSWMWGAEMGANEHGVAIGNEAIWTKVDVDDEEKLLGMDLVRLGLERGKTASDALDIITGLLEAHGQGGPCSDSDPGFSYHNSFLIVDSSEAWVLETAGSLWAAEKITAGFRNISNCLSIGKKIDKMSDNIQDKAVELGYWDKEGDFDFKKAFGRGSEDCSRYDAGKKLLQDLTKDGDFSLTSMFAILRDQPSNICRGADEGFPSQGSMVKPRFERTVDRSHVLYRRHTQAMKTCSPDLIETLMGVEKTCVTETEIYLKEFTEDRLKEVNDLFKDCVDSELKFYISK